MTASDSREERVTKTYQVVWCSTELGTEDIWLHNNGMRDDFGNLEDAKVFAESKKVPNKPFYWQPQIRVIRKTFCSHCESTLDEHISLYKDHAARRENE